MLNAPITPAEREVFGLIASKAAWRAPSHPRFKDRSAVLDWSAVRAAHDPDMAPWSMVRDLLRVVEVAVAKAERRSQEE